jgi:hypothetical protein
MNKTKENQAQLYAFIISFVYFCPTIKSHELNQGKASHVQTSKVICRCIPVLEQVRKDNCVELKRQQEANAKHLWNGSEQYFYHVLQIFDASGQSKGSHDSKGPKYEQWIHYPGR